MGWFEQLSFYDTVVVAALGGLVVSAFIQEKRIKVQDRQFRILLARLNELTGREIDNFDSELDED